MPGLHLVPHARVYDCQTRGCLSHLPGDLPLITSRCRLWPSLISQFGNASDNVRWLKPHRVLTRDLQPNRQQHKVHLSLHRVLIPFKVNFRPLPRVTHFPLYTRVSCGEFSHLHACRVGEAQHPGPWSLQVRNIVSANKHADELDCSETCTAWSETSASSATLSRLHKKARALKGYLTTSAPWDNRRPEQVGGQLLQALCFFHVSIRNPYISFGIEQPGALHASLTASSSWTACKLGLL